MDDDTPAPPRSYGCQYGCGNAMDVMLHQFIDGTTLVLCIPCFIRTAMDVVNATIAEATPEVRAMMQEIQSLDMVDTPTARARRGKHNAPVGTDSADLIEQYDTALTEDEIGAEFK